jgi:D-tyrosyl-tRNA(Tyr) deacylase
MRLLIQRVKQASVIIENKLYAQINEGLLVYIGIKKGDEACIISPLAKKLVNLRIFADENQKMNKSLIEIDKDILIVSQFTLYGNCTSGLRPDFLLAADKDLAHKLYLDFCKQVEKELKKSVAMGKFQADMQIFSINDGPITFILER